MGLHAIYYKIEREDEKWLILRLRFVYTDGHESIQYAKYPSRFCPKCGHRGPINGFDMNVILTLCPYHGTFRVLPVKIGSKLEDVL